MAQLRAIATARLEALQDVSDDGDDTGRPKIECAPGGLGMDELQAMAVRRQLDIGAVVEPIAAAPRTQREIDRETMMEAVGLCLAETERRAANALQRLRDEMLDRIAAIETQRG